MQTVICGIENRGRNRGITLIEMLVVLLIMGLLVSVTVLSTGLLDRRDSNESGVALALAEDLSRLFGHASQQALANNEVLGWSLSDDQQMTWWRWASTPLSGAGAIRSPRWAQAEDFAMSVLVLPEGIALQVRSDISSDRQHDNVPAVVFYPGREYSAFQIYVRSRGNGAVLARVWPERDGQIHWGAL